MTRGYDRPLYFLPFDHRGSFKTGMFGWKGAITPEQTARIAATKEVIYEGFKTAVASGVHKEKAGILWTSSLVRPYFATRGRKGTRPRALPKRAGRKCLTLSTARTSPNISRPSSQRFARCWCATTLKAIRR